MRAEIIAVGTELLLGNIVNTNAQFLSQQLSFCGIDVLNQAVVGDNATRLEKALILALNRADVVILTGGLGPTTDDITKETVAKVLNLELVEDENVLKSICEYYNRVGREITELSKKQALVMRGCTVLKNENGTAPGILIEGENQKTVILLPGPPRECENMFLKSVVPYLKKLSSEYIYSKNMYIVGVGEPSVEKTLGELIKSENPTVAIYAKDGEVQIRITAKADSKQAATQMANDLFGNVLELFGEDVYSVDEIGVEKALVHRLLENDLTVTTAESLTGGLISQKITSVPGASHVLKKSFVTYSNETKHSLLGVPKKVLKKHGAVSEKTAVYMALGAKKGADIGISATGVAGPGPDSDGIPAGEVFVAVATKKRVWAKHLKIGHGADERDFIREVCAKNVIDMARRAVEETPEFLLQSKKIKDAKSLKAPKPPRPLWVKILGIVLASLLSFSAILCGVTGWGHLVREFNSHKLQSVFNQDLVNYSPMSPVNQDGFDTRIDGLCAINPDCVGFLDFSVAKYGVLSRDTSLDFWGNSGEAPFIKNTDALVGDGKNVIVYSTKKGAENPFYPLLNYSSINFYKQNPTVTFYTLYGERKYKIFGAFYIADGDLDFQFEKYNHFNNIDETYLFVDNVKKRSVISSKVDIMENDSFLTVVLPCKQLDGVNFVVVARRFRRAETTFFEKDQATLNLTPLYPEAWYQKYGTTPPDFSALEGADAVIDVSSEFITVPIVSDTPIDVSSEETSTSSDVTSSENTSHETSSEVSSEVSSNEESSSNKTSSEVSSEVVSSSRPVSSQAVSSSRPVSSEAVSSSRPVSSETPVSSSRPVSSEEASSEPVSSEETSSEVVIPQDKTFSVYAGGRVVTSSAFDIISQIVANEVGNSSPIEAVKAQAVAAASFVEYYNSINQAPSVAFKEPSTAVKKAVAQVIDERVYYNGEIALTTYGSMAAGRTNNAEDVWGWHYPYLVSVESKYDHLAPNYRYEKTFSAQYVSDVVRQKLGISLSGDPNEWFDVVTETSGGYNGVMSVGGVNSYVNSSGKRVNITGRILRENVFSLRSAKFDVEYNADSDTFTFTTYGYGHGAGMSQWGAIYYAQNDGWDYKQILTHYYTGCEVR